MKIERNEIMNIKMKKIATMKKKNRIKSTKSDLKST